MNRLKAFVILILAMILIAGCISPELRTARISINEKDWQRALKALEGELQRDPNSAEAYYLHGFCHEQLGEWTKMAESYDKSIAISDEFKTKIKQNRQKLLARYINRGISLLDSTEWAKKKMELEEYPDSLAEADRERHALALAAIDTAILIDRGNPDIYVRGAFWAFDGKLHDRALEYSAWVLEHESGDEPKITVREIQMLVLREKGDYQAAVKSAKELMDLIPFKTGEDTLSYLRSLDIIIEAADSLQIDDLAMEVTQKALDRLPDNMILKKNLAVMFARKGDFEQAKNIYYEVLKKDPNDYNANLDIGIILYNNHKWEDAIPYLHKFNQLQPDDERVIKMLMGCYFNTDQEDKGLEMQKKLLNLEDREK